MPFKFCVRRARVKYKLFRSSENSCDIFEKGIRNIYSDYIWKINQSYHDFKHSKTFLCAIQTISNLVKGQFEASEAA